VRRGLLLGLVAMVLVACGSDDDTAEAADPRDEPVEAADDPTEDVGDVDEVDDVAEVEEDEEPEPPGSSVEITGEIDRTEVEIRAAEILTELEASPEPEGAVVEIPDEVLFDFDSAQLRPEAAEILDDIVEVMLLLEEAPAQVRGHTDNVGDDDYNLQLSLDRADAVAAYLVDAGIEADRIETEGLGSTEPVADNENPDGSDNPEGRALNRRVEVVLPTVDLETLGED
jgi:outer membrane protein OmpA-like peptidoglycan-associated protein